METTAAHLARPRSQQAWEDALPLMPGGVNSPVRAFNAVVGEPIFIQRAKGAYLWDLDGNRYVDYVGAWGPAILGHAHPDVLHAVQSATDNGLGFGTPTLAENTLARMVIDMVPSIESVRFVNSGTEACMSAIRLARAFTGCDKIIKFAGCYHGHADSFLVKAGSGATTLGVPDSPGVPKALADLTLTAQFNDAESVDALLDTHAGTVAAIIVEPVAGNMGCIPPESGFLDTLRALADKYDVLLIFDEVMTGFRVARGGAQARYGVTPDLTTLGKIVGGGLPVGAYGGRKDIMAMVAPAGPMYQAGTLSGNPLAMAAGIETLKHLNETGLYAEMESLTALLLNGLLKICQDKGIPAVGTQVGTMFSVFFTDHPVTDYTTAMQGDTARFSAYHAAMLDRGVYLAPSAFESGFISAAHTEADIHHTLAAARESL